MTEASFEKVVQERQFAGLLQTHAETFFRLTNSLLRDRARWTKKHYFQLISECESLESFLDDYGARYNRTYGFLTETIASLRGFAQSGYTMAHLIGRLDSYGSGAWFSAQEIEEAGSTLRCTTDFLRRSTVALIETARAEGSKLGLELTPEYFPETNFLPVLARRSLPRNVGQDEPTDEEQKIAEVASRFIQASDMLGELGIRPIDDTLERRALLARICNEEQARVYEATVHNLQSAYDTFIKNTVIESRDERLPLLRGQASAALHLLQCVTFLVHFCERHENLSRSDEVVSRLESAVPKSSVEEITLNHLLHWAARILDEGRRIAEELLPAYTNVQELEVVLMDGMSLHARPASLIVGVVNHYGTPVEMNVGGKRCNAASILELLVTVGSHPEVRTYSFCGDENPLRDIALLFESGLGEQGVDTLPDPLRYLRNG